MTNLVADITRTVEILPYEEQRFAYEFIKRLVLAWDPNFTKVTSEEAQKLKLAEESGFICDEDINWDSIGL